MPRYQKPPPYGTRWVSGRRFDDVLVDVQRARSLSTGGGLDVYAGGSGTQVVDNRPLAYWMAVTKNARVSSAGGVANPPAYAYGGRLVLVDENWRIRQDPQLFCDRFYFPLLEMNQDPAVPEGSVVYAVPAPDISHYRFVWSGFGGGSLGLDAGGSGNDGLCTLRISDFFQRVGGSCQYRDGRLCIVDADGNPVGLRLQLEFLE